MVQVLFTDSTYYTFHNSDGRHDGKGQNRDGRHNDGDEQHNDGKGQQGDGATGDKMTGGTTTAWGSTATGSMMRQNSLSDKPPANWVSTESS